MVAALLGLACAPAVPKDELFAATFHDSGLGSRLDA
jgi:hypothetical protein